MSDKYVVFNKKDCFKPLSLNDKEGNSITLEFNTEQDAQSYIEKLKCEYKNESFLASSIDEWYAKLKTLEECEESVEIPKEIFEEARPNVYDYDKKIKDFQLPIIVKDNYEYISVLNEKISEFKDMVSQEAFSSEIGLGEEVNDNCDLIISAIQDLIIGGTEDADNKVKKLLLKYMENEFAVSELDKSYAFRGLSVYKGLHPLCTNEDFYKEMLETELSFFRARVVDKITELSDIRDIISLPFSKRNLSKDLRFSAENEICLYLGVTSYVCSLECGYDIEENKEQDIYLSAFRFNSQGKKLKILNLVVSESLITGMRNLNKNIARNLWNDLIKIFPLILATSFTVDDKDEKRKKYEYLLSQSIIRVIKGLGIDGVAYLSRRGENDFQYPHGVNLAIPMNDIRESKEYSDLYNHISCTKPVLVGDTIYQWNGNERSYINQCYSKYKCGTQENFGSKINYNGNMVFYGETPYSMIDDYLLNQ